MGACYSVELRVHVLDENGAVNAILAHKEKDSRTAYSVQKCVAAGVALDTFDGLIKLLLAEHQQRVMVQQDGAYRFYSNAFDASYGWESVMLEWFEVLAPFLADDSKLLIYPDHDYDEVVIRDGKAIQIH